MMPRSRKPDCAIRTFGNCCNWMTRTKELPYRKAKKKRMDEKDEKLIGDFEKKKMYGKKQLEAVNKCKDAINKRVEHKSDKKRDLFPSTPFLLHTCMTDKNNQIREKLEKSK